MISDRIILGIDPGTTIMGFGVIHIREGKMELVDYGTLNLKNTDGQPLKLKKIFEFSLKLIEKHKPDELAIESPFFAKNIQSMLKLGRAQGVAIAAALYRMVPIVEYSPKKIKLSVTGNGNASKEQVAGMLKHLLRMTGTSLSLDATDALAVAVCHFFQLAPGIKSSAPGEKKYKNWKAFVEQKGV